MMAKLHLTLKISLFLITSFYVYAFRFYLFPGLTHQNWEAEVLAVRFLSGGTNSHFVYKNQTLKLLLKLETLVFS